MRSDIISTPRRNNKWEQCDMKHKTKKQDQQIQSIILEISILQPTRLSASRNEKRERYRWEGSRNRIRVLGTYSQLLHNHIHHKDGLARDGRR